MQLLGGVQSASETQLDLQVVELQMYVPQETSTSVTQAPAPSQIDGGVWAEAVEHSAGLQLSPLAK